MPLEKIYLDLETRSAADLRAVGVYEYANHPSTEILCAAYAIDDGPIKIWKLGQELPRDLKYYISPYRVIECHNAHFEWHLWNYVGAKKYGWPYITIAQMDCTMVRAYAMGLPGSLENCAAALGISEHKDLAGGRLMLQMAKPRSVKPDGSLVLWERPDQLERLYQYCIQDVNVERLISKRMPKLSAYEKKVWLLDFEINHRGILVDKDAVQKAVALAESEKKRLDEEMREISEGHIASCSAVAQIKDYLEFYGVNADSLDKAALNEYLNFDENLNPVAKRILELRQEAGKSSTAKFEPMAVSSGEDGRLRGCFQYSGANTRRWSGRRVQLHNLKQQKIPFPTIEKIINEIKNGVTAEELNLFYGNPLSLLSECTRSFLMAASGHTLGIVDFAAIEARVLAWLAGEEKVLDVFRKNEDIYKEAAGQIFGCSPSEIGDEDSRRQVGKVAVLALGYGGGVGAFQTMAKGYGVKMKPAYSNLMEIATLEIRTKAIDRWEEKKNQVDISKEEFIASEITKLLWRLNNPNIVNYWYSVENAAIEACLKPKTIVKVNNISFRKVGSFLWCQLPGGGVICYPYPEVKNTSTRWGELRQQFSYMSEDGMTKKWQRFTTYGGSLVENITQAVARDILADAMLRLDANGYKIVAHVHDEIVAEIPKSKANLSNMINIITENPSWAGGLPLKAKGKLSDRYCK